MKKFMGVIAIIMVVLILLTGCAVENASVDAQQVKQQEQIQKDMNNQVGLPDIKEWTEKKIAKEIYELRDNSKLVCYAYTKNEMTGKYVYEGRCMGFGLPYSTQYSNPQKVVEADHELGYDLTGYVNDPLLKPQAEPNGLFMPDSAAATWLIMIDEDTGKREIQYYEPNLVVTQNKKPTRLCEEWSLPKDY